MSVLSWLNEPVQVKRSEVEQKLWDEYQAAQLDLKEASGDFSPEGRERWRMACYSLCRAFDALYREQYRI